MAGVSSKEIKNRIRSMESTKQITKAMEMVAASKLRKTQARIASSRPYFEILYHAMQEIAQGGRDFTSPYLERRKGNRRLFIVIAGDRGLAGGYNSNILKQVQADPARDMILPMGKKAADWFKAKAYTLLTDAYPQASEVEVGDCFSMAKQVCRAYLAGQVDEVILCYTRFQSVLSQTPEAMKLLPLTPSEGAEDSHRDTVYEGAGEDVFAAIVPEYLGGVLYGALCESTASEQAARRAAMDSATQNAEDLIADLSLKFNRARQAAITQEITEIIAGS